MDRGWLSPRTVSRNLRFVATYGSFDAWHLLSDPSRRLILQVLAAVPSSVSDLARVLPISRPAVSQHLKVLKEAGLVRHRPEGTRRIYSVDTRELSRHRDQLERFWRETIPVGSGV